MQYDTRAGKCSDVEYLDNNGNLSAQAGAAQSAHNRIKTKSSNFKSLQSMVYVIVYSVSAGFFSSVISQKGHLGSDYFFFYVSIIVQ